jgi:hypothetical protein
VFLSLLLTCGALIPNLSLPQFAELMKRASANTAQQQANHAKEEQARKDKEKAEQAVAARKAEEARKLAEQRRVEREKREERERKQREREEAKKAALPKTTNLYALKKEREKRGLDPNGKDDHLLPGNKVRFLLRHLLFLLAVLTLFPLPPPHLLSPTHRRRN